EETRYDRINHVEQFRGVVRFQPASRLPAGNEGSDSTQRKTSIGKPQRKVAWHWRVDAVDRRCVRLSYGHLLFSVPFVPLAGEIPPPVLPAGLGVNIHFVSGHQRDLDLIAAAGFKFVRMDFGWTSTESKKGEYRWTEYDELVADLARREL